MSLTTHDLAYLHGVKLAAEAVGADRRPGASFGHKALTGLGGASVGNLVGGPLGALAGHVGGTLADLSDEDRTHLMLLGLTLGSLYGTVRGGVAGWQMAKKESR